MEEITVILACIVFNAMFAAYEMAFVAVSRADLRELGRSGKKVAQQLLKRRDRPERTLSTIQVGITLVGAIAATVGGTGASDNIEPYLIDKMGIGEAPAELFTILLVVVPITYLSVVIGELVPKSLALRNPTKIALKGGRWLFLADRLLSPVVTVFERSTKLILRIMPLQKKRPQSEERGSIDLDSLSPIHQKMMFNLADIEGRLIRDIYVTWENTTYVSRNDKIEQVAQIVLKSGHTRLPVVDGEEIVGILHTKEFLALKELGETEWIPLIRPAMILKQSESALRALRLLQEKRNHMAIVISKSNKRLGIVTLEDILEEVVGDIYDEDDDEKIRKIFASRSRLKDPRRNIDYEK